MTATSTGRVGSGLEQGFTSFHALTLITKANSGLLTYLATAEQTVSEAAVGANSNFLTKTPKSLAGVVGNINNKQQTPTPDTDALTGSGVAGAGARPGGHQPAEL